MRRSGILQKLDPRRLSESIAKAFLHHRLPRRILPALACGVTAFGWKDVPKVLSDQDVAHGHRLIVGVLVVG